MKNDNSDGDGLLRVCVPDEVCAPVSSASVWESILHRAYSVAWSIEWKSEYGQSSSGDTADTRSIPLQLCDTHTHTHTHFITLFHWGALYTPLSPTLLLMDSPECVGGAGRKRRLLV